MTDRFKSGLRLVGLTEDTVGDAGKHRNTRMKPTVLKAIKSSHHSEIL
jgi:hypothetical protein